MAWGAPAWPAEDNVSSEGGGGPARDDDASPDVEDEPGASEDGNDDDDNESDDSAEDDEGPSPLDAPEDDAPRLDGAEEASPALDDGTEDGGREEDEERGTCDVEGAADRGRHAPSAQAWVEGQSPSTRHPSRHVPATHCQPRTHSTSLEQAYSTVSGPGSGHATRRMVPHAAGNRPTRTPLPGRKTRLMDRHPTRSPLPAGGSPAARPLAT
jgi:hypothetical protein